jgi:hypothetical protein
MTKPAAETIEREKDKLWLNDAELVRWMGMPEKKGYEVLRELERKNSGFPRKQKLWGGRRYKPAVKEFFDKVYGVSARERSERR